MSGPGEDDPLDLRAVAADDVAVEAVRRPRAVSPDVRAGAAAPSDDAALTLLQELLADIGRDPLPEHGRPALRTAAVAVRPVRLLRRGSAAALVTVGVLSLTGVAAASTLAPAGTPLHGVGEAVRSAAAAVREAVAPDVSAGSRAPLPAASAPASPSAAVARSDETGTTAPTADPRSATAGAARSAAAAAQVARWLDEAARHLGAGRTAQAAARLDAAERRLPEVLPADGSAALRSRLVALRAQVAAAPTAKTGAPERAARPDDGPAAPGRTKPRTAPGTSGAGPRTAPEKGPKADRPAPERTSSRSSDGKDVSDTGKAGGGKGAREPGPKGAAAR